VTIISRGGVLLALGLEGMGTRVPPPAWMIDLHFNMKGEESVYFIFSILHLPSASLLMVMIKKPTEHRPWKACPET